MRWRRRWSPLARRRWAAFRANRRGFVSAMLFTLLFAVALASPWLAADRPWVVRVGGRWYWPLWQNVSEAELGGVFETAADFRDPYVADTLIRARGGWMLWPPIPYGHDTVDLDAPEPAPSPPGRRHWLGTDDLGRDVLARVLHGLRISLLFGLALTVVSAVIGTLLGLWQGYAGGWVDLIAQRLIELWGAMPRLYILIIMSAVIEPGFGSLLGILLLFSWMSLVHVVRAETLRARNFEYVRAARALGVPEWRIALRHVLPNALVAAMTYLPFQLAGSLTMLTSLDFLGLGLPPGSPSLGEMLQQGKANLHAPWLGLTAFVALSTLFMLVVFIGEAARDAMDPRKTMRSGGSG
ncbi:MAG: ABC transporter permease [Kiritimatiellae bacterium]|nr:ABC transporter permease [Kiritimatiellia bacterium]